MTLNAELDRSAEDALIDLCLKRTVHILQWARKANSYRYNQLGMQIEDIAYDIIAELVIEIDGVRCAPLRGILLNVQDEQDDALLSNFEGILFGYVSQSMTRLFSEVNRTQYLLLRSLRYNAERQENVVSRDRLDGRWYLLHSESEARLHLPGMPVEELRQYLRGADLKQRPFALALLNEILKLLDGQEEYRKAVRESDVLQIALDIVGTQFASVMETEVPESDMVDVKDTLRHAERCLHRALEMNREWAEEFYTDKGRLNDHDLQAFQHAASSYVRDSFLGTSGSQYSYLREILPGLTQHRYRESYKNRLEYFIKKVVEVVGILMKKERDQVPD